MDGSVMIFFGSILALVTFVIWKTRSGIRAMRPQNQLSKFESMAKRRGLRVIEDMANNRVYATAFVPDGTSSDHMDGTIPVDHPIKLIVQKLRLSFVIAVSVLVTVLYSCAPG